MYLDILAHDIYQHQKDATVMGKITAAHTELSLKDAYNIQRINIEKDLQAGDQFVGWKMGLTSLAKQQSVGVHQPIYGRLLKSMRFSGEHLSLRGLIHPRVEPEFAFLINKKLEGNKVTEQDVWQATAAIIPALEVIDSRYRDFSFNLVDVVADNASSAKFLLGEQVFIPNQFQWENVKVQLKLNGHVVQGGKGADVMEHPVRSVIELVKMLHSEGLCVEPGMIVLTGGITEAIDLKDRDTLTVEFGQVCTLFLKADY
jgi:2-oxo-3-hexenedioate decarboxylase